MDDLVSPYGTNSGHGHVWKRPDGVRMRCGGPPLCGSCASDAAKYGQDALAARITALEADKAGLVDGLKVALRAADLALFAIRKQGVKLNDSWEAGFNSDTAAARAALELHGGGK